MKLYYYRGRQPNFGDELNPWMWLQLLPNLFSEDDSSTFLGVGSILYDHFPEDTLKIVFGAGYGAYTPAPNVHTGSWDIYFVRGPQTAEVLGLDSASPFVTRPFFYEPSVCLSRLRLAVSASCRIAGARILECGVKCVNRATLSSLIPALPFRRYWPRLPERNCCWLRPCTAQLWPTRCGCLDSSRPLQRENHRNGPTGADRSICPMSQRRMPPRVSKSRWRHVSDGSQWPTMAHDAECMRRSDCFLGSIAPSRGTAWSVGAVTSDGRSAEADAERRSQDRRSHRTDRGETHAAEAEG